MQGGGLMPALHGKASMHELVPWARLWFNRDGKNFYSGPVASPRPWKLFLRPTFTAGCWELNTTIFEDVKKKYEYIALAYLTEYIDVDTDEPFLQGCFGFGWVVVKVLTVKSMAPLWIYLSGKPLPYKPFTAT